MKKWLFLLRGFFPSWRLFDNVGTSIRLEVRYGARPERLGGWQNALPPIARSYRNLVLNPNGNYLHACHSLLQQLVTEINERDLSGDAVAQLASFRLVKNLAAFQIAQSGEIEGAFHYEFRVQADGDETALASPTYEGPA